MPTYAEQFARVQRCLHRIETHDRSTQDYDDDMWSFFQNCWHLRDWVANDAGLPPKQRDAISALLYKSANLLICADLANATKHLQLNRPQVGAKHHHRNYRLIIGGQPSSKVEYFIDRGDGTHCDGLQLARDCVAEWRDILTKSGLNP